MAKGGFPPTVSIEDNGAGMTEEEIREDLSKIGVSGTDKARRDLIARGSYALAKQLIGEFGLGLLSAFVVADEVEVETLSRLPRSTPLKWSCKINGEWSLDEGTRRDPGTQITLYLRRGFDEFSRDDQIRRSVKKYADFLQFPIFLGSRGADRINVVNAPWHRDSATVAEKDYLDYLKERHPDEDLPLAVFPLHITGGVEADGVLYIPRRVTILAPEGGVVDVYVKRMFIRERMPELLPSWARFVKGIVDSPSLNVTMNREDIVRDDRYTQVRIAIEQSLASQFGRLASERPGTFREIVWQHHLLLMAGAVDSDLLFDAIADDVPFVSDKAEGGTTLSKYLERAADRAQEELRNTLFYFNEPRLQSQYRALFAEKEIEVLDASASGQEAFLRKYAERKSAERKKKEPSEPEIYTQRMDVGVGTLFAEVDLGEEPDWGKLIVAYRRYINPPITAKAVRFQPLHIPAVIVSGAEEADLGGVRQLLDFLSKDTSAATQTFVIPLRRLLSEHEAKRPEPLLYINVDNIVIKDLVFLLDERLDDAVTAMLEIYHNALLFTQEPLSQQSMNIIFDIHNRAIGRLLELSKKTQGLEQQYGKLSEEKAALEKERNEALTEVIRLRDELARLQR
jgi:molecular chaperone HtpG